MKDLAASLGTPMVGPLNLLILGAGAVSQEYYIPALRTLRLLRQTTVNDSSSAALNEIRERSNDVKILQANFRECLRVSTLRNSFDAAIIALPNSLHEEATALALDYKLHVLCEKPLALTHAACLRLADQVKAGNRVLSVGMVRRLLPSVCAVREALSQSLIGELVSIDIEDGVPYNWLSDSGAPFQPENGGILADMGIHYLDLIEYLVGELSPIKYQDDSCGGVEANVEFRLQTVSGVPVRLALSRTHRLRNTAVFRGQGGELILEKDSFDTCVWKPNCAGYRAKLYPTRPFTNLTWPLTFESCFAEQLVRFALAVRGEGNNYVSADEAAMGVKLIEWAYEHRTRPKSEIALSGRTHRPTLPVAPVVVTGGTGFIGTNLVRRLNEIGFDQITLALRSYRTCAAVARFPVNMHRVNLLDYAEVKSLVQGARHIFHLAYGQDGPRPSRVTIEGTRNVVEAAIAQHVESIVILSSIYVFGRPETQRPIDETWPNAAIGGEYGKSKAAMESWCLKRAHSSDPTRIVILNPSCVYGPFGKTYTQMPIQMARERTFCWIDEGQGAANYTYVDNLVDAMLVAAESQEAHGQRFIINDGTTTWREFLKPLLGPYAERLPSYTKKQLFQLVKQNKHGNLFDAVRVIASDPRVVSILKKSFAFRVPLDLAAQYSPHILDKIRKRRSLSIMESSVSIENPSPPVWLADLFPCDGTRFSAEKACRLLNWKPIIELKKGQELTVEWLRSINHIGKNCS